MKGDERLKINPDIVFREEGEEAFLFDPDRGSLKCINRLGMAIWRMCGESKTVDDVIASVADEHPEVPRDTISGDVTRFLRALLDMGYLGYLCSTEG